MSTKTPTFSRLMLPLAAVLLLAVLGGWIFWLKRSCPPLLLDCRAAVTEAPVGQAMTLDLRLRLPPGVTPQKISWQLGPSAVGHDGLAAHFSSLEVRGLVWSIHPRLSGIAKGELGPASLSVLLSDGSSLRANLPVLRFSLPETDPTWLPPAAPPLPDSLLAPPRQNHDWLRLVLLVSALTGAAALIVLGVLFWRRRQASPEQLYRDECLAASLLPEDRRQAEHLLAFRRWCWRRLELPLSLSGSELAAALGRHPRLPQHLAANAATILAGQEEQRFLPAAQDSSLAGLDALVAAPLPEKKKP